MQQETKLVRIAENSKKKLHELAQADSRSMKNYLDTMINPLYTELKGGSKMIAHYLEGKTKEYFIGKTPPEIWQEVVQECGSAVGKKELKRTILETFSLLVKTSKVDGVAQRVYHDTPVHPILPFGSIPNLPNEEWREIVGYEGLYLISSHGRVKSLFKDGEKLLEPQVLNNGYLKVCLSVDGSQETRLVHRLVASSFISNPNKHPQVDHFNMIKNDCHVWNLRWVSASQNQTYAQIMKPLLAKEENQRVLAEIHRLNTTEQSVKEPNIIGSPEALEAYNYIKGAK